MKQIHRVHISHITTSPTEACREKETLNYQKKKERERERERETLE